MFAVGHLTGKFPDYLSQISFQIADAGLPGVAAGNFFDGRSFDLQIFGETAVDDLLGPQVIGGDVVLFIQGVAGKSDDFQAVT